MPLEVPYLLACGLLAMAILTCLWLTLNSKAEFRSREKTLERRVNLLEERLELHSPALAAPRAKAALHATQTLTPSFSYQVSIPRKAPAVATESRPVLIPEQLEFLSSLKAGKPAL